MPKSPTFSNDMLLLICNGVAIAGLADNAASSPLTVLYFALHTAAPSVGSAQTLNEVSYSGYGRISVARTSAGLLVTGTSVSPVALIEFATVPSGAFTVTHFSLGTDASGAGKVLYYGTVSPVLNAFAGVAPRLGTTTAIQET